MGTESSPKKPPDTETSIPYNLRKRKITRKEEKMGLNLPEDRVQLIQSDEDDDGKKMYLGNSGDGLYEETFSISEGDSDEIMLLTEDVERQPKPKKYPKESSLTILMQVLLPFSLAGMGMVAAGLVLDSVQHWPVFLTINELFIMVPALLGLKGNLEMTLASRLSTHSNLGHLDNKKSCVSLVMGNLSLIQCQALVVGFLASVVAVLMGFISSRLFDIHNVVLLCASAMVTASLASFILGVIMVGVILLSRRCNVNPDNIATPIAASLGDLITLSLLSGIASLLYQFKDSWATVAIPVFYLLSMPLWIWLARKDESTKEVLRTGWFPVILAMIISSIGGMILDKAVAAYKGIAVFQPVINGVGGNLVAVQASRISTSLHLTTTLGVLPNPEDKICISPFKAFCSDDSTSRTARVLLLLVIPGHLTFLYVISWCQAGHTSLTLIFVITYLIAAVLQVIILLYAADVMTIKMWKCSIDPDNSAIPYLTACGDLLGTGFLAVAFHFLFLVGDRDSDLGD